MPTLGQMDEGDVAAPLIRSIPPESGRADEPRHDPAPAPRSPFRGCCHRSRFGSQALEVPGIGTIHGLRASRPRRTAPAVTSSRGCACDVLVDPLQDQVGDLQVVLVLHDHVAVAADAAVLRVEHLCVTARRLEAADQLLTAIEGKLPRRPRRDACRRVAVITEDDENRHLRQRLDLLGRVRLWKATRLDQHEAPCGRGIEQRRFQGKPSGLRMPDEHRAIQLPGELGQRLERRVGRGQAAIADVGHALLRQLVHRGHRELGVRERGARLRAEAEVRPDDLVAESQQGGQAARGRGARTHVVEEGLIEARAPAAHLVRHVHRMALAHEVLVPAHPAVRCRLPRLAGQRRAVDHHHRDVAVATLGHHVAHVHLVDGDVPAGTEAAQLEPASARPCRRRRRSCLAPSAPGACRVSADR